MLIEEVELTLSHVGLGRLSEYALLALFASAQAHALTRDTGGTLHDVRDADGHSLYPGYYMTHLRVPPTRTLGSWGVWDRAALAVEVACFGGVLLDSKYRFASSAQELEGGRGPSMHASSMFMLADHGSGEPQLAKPRAGCVAKLEALRAPPASMDRFRRARVEGRIDASELAPRSRAVTLDVRAGRDAAPGHNMMFAKFSELMGLAERRFLAEQLRLSEPLLDCLTPLERETYYFANVGANERVEVDVRVQLAPVASDTPKENERGVLLGLVRTQLELSAGRDRELLALSRAEHVFEVPSAQQSVMRAAERALRMAGV